MRLKPMGLISSQPSNYTPATIKPYLTLEAWRGLASLAVVMFHWSELVILHRPALAANPLYASSLYGFLGVQVFFVVSGYCIANAAASNLRKADGVLAFFRARVLRIYPAYWAALLLACAFTMGGHFLADQGIIEHNVFTDTNLLALPPAFYFSNVTLTMLPLHQSSLLVVAWTLCYELAFYFIVGLALWMVQIMRRPSLLLDVLNCFTVIILAILIVGPQQLSFPLDLWPQFGLGIVVYDLLARPTARRAKIVNAIIVMEFTAFIALYNVPLGAMGVTSRLSFLVALLFATILVMLYRADTAIARLSPSRILGWVGLFSYSLYLTHAMTVRVVNQVSKSLHFPDSLHYLLFIISIAVSLGVGYIFYLCCEKPLLRKKARLSVQTQLENSVINPESQRKGIGIA